MPRAKAKSGWKAAWEQTPLKLDHAQRVHLLFLLDHRGDQRDQAIGQIEDVLTWYCGAVAKGRPPTDKAIQVELEQLLKHFEGRPQRIEGLSTAARDVLSRAGVDVRLAERNPHAFREAVVACVAAMHTKESRGTRNNLRERKLVTMLHVIFNWYNARTADGSVGYRERIQVRRRARFISGVLKVGGIKLRRRGNGSIDETRHFRDLYDEDSLMDQPLFRHYFERDRIARRIAEERRRSASTLDAR